VTRPGFKLGGDLPPTVGGVLPSPSCPVCQSGQHLGHTEVSGSGGGISLLLGMEGSQFVFPLAALQLGQGGAGAWKREPVVRRLQGPGQFQDTNYSYSIPTNKTVLDPFY
jgi:hypothetical protein